MIVILKMDTTSLLQAGDKLLFFTALVPLILCQNLPTSNLPFYIYIYISYYFLFFLP